MIQKTGISGLDCQILAVTPGIIGYTYQIN
jgi:hypothetical protein